MELSDYELPLLHNHEGSKLFASALNPLRVKGGRGAWVDAHATTHLYQHFPAC